MRLATAANRRAPRSLAALEDEFCFLLANRRKPTPPCRPAKPPRHETQGVGRRPISVPQTSCGADS